ncbi:MAG TPA: hypothetical protein IAA98_04430 [Candidatus Avipropionibacterium avicola]|uniref:Secreted protein n=1 Tax=Candidatus Avipropionibacterium avicola TaxID=2840701 RepID=A0A9D1GWK9_9ACTN|nr:hypothetical protein [Candidatus Avipropionibacterium avicola]
MSQSASATGPAPATATGPRPGTAPRPGTGALAPTRTGAPPSPKPGAAQAQRSTPRSLRLWTLATVLACAVFALTSLATMWNATTAGSEAADDAAQLVRIQSIRANLLRADSLATNAFLVGGLESADQRSAYDEALEETTQLLAEAAAAQPEDRESLSVLNRAVLRYAADMEQARANNRQGYPVGAGYLSEASAELRTAALPILEELAAVNQQRANDQLEANNHPWFELIGIAAVVVLVVAMFWTARRFRRVINVGLLVATALALVTLVAGMAVLANNRSVSDDIRSGDLDTITTVGAMRAAANEAKVQESLRLIAHGSGASHEEAWKRASQDVEDGLSGSGGNLRQLWANYVEAHETVVENDENGKWEDAVEFATGGDDDSPNATFDAFDDEASAMLDASADQVRQEADRLAVGPMVLLFLGVPALVVAAIFSAVGLRARLKEYQ